MWQYYNPNPLDRKTSDCAVRAIAKALDVDWETAYVKLTADGFAMGDLPNSNQVISAVLRTNGFYKMNIPNTCPECYSIGDFSRDNPDGTFVLGTGTHVVCVKDGNVFDTWDSTDLIPIFVFYKDVEPRIKEV